MSMPNVKTVICRINHVNLRVRDLRASVRFYRDVLGLDDRAVIPPSIMSRECVAHHNGQGHAFGIVLTQGLPAGTELVGVDHIALEVPSVDDVQEIYQRAVREEMRVTHPRMYEGHWQIFVFDPDGHKLEVMAAQEPHKVPVNHEPNAA